MLSLIDNAAFDMGDRKNLFYHSTLLFIIDKEPTNTYHKVW